MTNDTHLNNKYQQPLSLMHVDPLLHNNPSTSSTLESIKNFFTGKRNAKSKQIVEASKMVGSNTCSLQPLLIQGQAEPIWRYPPSRTTNIIHSCEEYKQPNISGDYSVVYQPNCNGNKKNFDETLRVSDCPQNAVLNMGGHNSMVTSLGPPVIHSLAADSSFSSTVFGIISLSSSIFFMRIGSEPFAI